MTELEEVYQINQVTANMTGPGRHPESRLSRTCSSLSLHYLLLHHTSRWLCKDKMFLISYPV